MSEQPIRVQVVAQVDGTPVLLEGSADCYADPCDHHGTCHCMCVCMPESPDNCADCAEACGDDQ